MSYITSISSMVRRWPSRCGIALVTCLGAPACKSPSAGSDAGMDAAVDAAVSGPDAGLVQPTDASTGDAVDASIGDAETTQPDCRTCPPAPPEVVERLPADQEPYRAGSRLRPSYLASADGLHAFDAMVDTALDAPCEPAVADDGTWRCLPDLLRNTHQNWIPWRILAFSDAACESWALFPSNDPDSPDVLGSYLRVPDRCHTSYAIVEKGEPFESNGRVYYRDGKGACVAVYSEPGTWYHVTPVAGDEFVPVMVQHSEAQAGLRAEFFSGADGSLWLSRYANEAQGMPCEFKNVVGETRCVLSADQPHSGFKTLPSAGFFADDACSMSAGVWNNECSPSPPYFVKFSDVCETEVEQVFEAQGELETVYRLGAPGQCSLGPVGPEFELRALQTVEPDVLVTVEAVREGGTRLVANRWKKGTLPSLPSSQLYGAYHDLELDADCTPGSTADGTTRCLPGIPAVASGGAYAFAPVSRDASCAADVAVFHGPFACAANAPAGPRFLFAFGRKAEEVVELGAQLVDVPQLWGWRVSMPSNELVCTPITPNEGDMFFELVRQVPAAELVEVTSTLE